MKPAWLLPLAVVAACSPAQPIDASAPDATADAGDVAAEPDDVDAESPADDVEDAAVRTDAPGDDGPACGDTQTDVNNCGACGVTCASLHVAGGVTCFMGYCAGSCEPGWSDCNHDVHDGCETHTTVDPMNCSTCGHTCDAGTCSAGFCG